MKRVILVLSKNLRPAQILLLGYITIIVIGFTLLSFPVMQKEAINSLDNLFVTASAASTTGLSTIDVGTQYSVLGQIILLIIIQLGGLGYMSIASFIVLGGKQNLSRFTSTLIKEDFDLSENYDIVSFVKSIIWFSFIFETLGTIGLYFIFSGQGVANPFWSALFHSISAFCTAGLSLFPNGLEGFSTHFGLNAIISVLAIAGCVGFIVFADLFQKFTGKKDSITLTSKIILRFTCWTLAAGTFLMFIAQTSANTEELEHRWLIAFFQTMTAVTTVGFNTWPISVLSHAVTFLIILLMLVGASPAGTGGGIKSTTISAMFAVTLSALKERREIIFLGREIPEHRVRMAVANFFFYFLIVGIGIFLLLLTETLPAYDLIFEATSALGTVGLNMGATGNLSDMGKLIIILLMFLGRIGALTFGLSILKKEEKVIVSKEDCDVVI